MEKNPEKFVALERSTGGSFEHKQQETILFFFHKHKRWQKFHNDNNLNALCTGNLHSAEFTESWVDIDRLHPPPTRPPLFSAGRTIQHGEQEQ